ncbi:hypothetical protein BSL82_04490 [Tardibacter chloracetimidivorans]|uniref:HTH araC/xylS-type domain-containing protein n=1 Tax=Tardibacter chloracetimidivorans TaxID=1921510 RepID=A0A1L3ZST2_9SPHN|nr:AraC family transcriptional regulator [Tardibacter chloracetimidivorans]API58659.1 hypothetical protein BSL82_04490 [Tardibacter chloracetimidivorans]
MATISGHYFRVCTRGAEHAGVDRAALLLRAALHPGEINAPGWRGSVQSMTLLVQAIWAELNDEFMGFTSQPVKPGTLAMMTELALTGRTVLEALRKGIAFYGIVTNAVVTELEVEGDDVLISVKLEHPELDPDHYLLEFWLIIWHRFACWLAGEIVPITLVELPYPRPTGYLDELYHLFPAEQRFDEPRCRLRLPLDALAVSIMPDEAARQQMVRRAPFDFMTIPGHDHSLAHQVRTLLMPRGNAVFFPLSVTQIGAALGIQPVTLSRRLRAEGATVSGIIQAIRRELATSRLLGNGTTVEDIAVQLGYDEPRSFTRAFRQWMGVSPRQFRKLALNDVARSSDR